MRQAREGCAALSDRHKKIPDSATCEQHRAESRVSDQKYARMGRQGPESPTGRRPRAGRIAGIGISELEDGRINNPPLKCQSRVVKRFRGLDLRRFINLVVAVTNHRIRLVLRSNLTRQIDLNFRVMRILTPENSKNLTQTSRQNQIETDINS